MQLNLGCGKATDASFVNVDIVPGRGVDVVHDLDMPPWPWTTGSVSTIRALDIFEHVDEPITFMTECWRVLTEGGRLHIRTGYWKNENAFTDPTHKRFPTEHTFDYWIPGTDLYDADAAYAGSARFFLEHYALEGQEQVFVLVKLP